MLTNQYFQTTNLQVVSLLDSRSICCLICFWLRVINGERFFLYVGIVGCLVLSLFVSKYFNIFFLIGFVGFRFFECVVCEFC